MTGPAAPARSPAAGTWSLLIPIAMLVVFAPTLSVPIAQDDYQLLMFARQYDAAALLRHYLPFHALQYRPTQLVYMAALLNVFGLNAFAYHAVNLVLFIFAAWLVARIAGQMGLGSAGRLTAGVTYGCHAALAAWVMWTCAAHGSIAIVLMLLAMSLFLGRPSFIRTIAATLAFALALTAREVAVLLPPLLASALWIQHRAARESQPSRPVLHIVRRSALAWLVVALYLVLRVPVLARKTPGGAYAVGVGRNIWSNSETLVGEALGLLKNATDRFAGSSALIGGALMAALLLIAVLFAISGRPHALLGLAWFALGLLPPVVLSTHGMDPHYLDVALVGLAIALGALADQWSRMRIAPRLQRAALVLAGAAYVFWNSSVVSAALAVSPVAFQANRAATMIDDVRRQYPSIPAGATLFLFGTDDAVGHAIGYGDALRLACDDPTLRVLFAHRPELLPPPDQRHDAFFAFEFRYGHLIDRTAAVRYAGPRIARVATEIPRIDRLYPARTAAGEPFNVQPDSRAALVLDCRNATPDTVVVWGTTPLESTYGSSERMTAIVPAELFARPGACDVWLLNSAGRSRAMPLIVE